MRLELYIIAESFSIPLRNASSNRVDPVHSFYATSNGFTFLTTSANPADLPLSPIPLVPDASDKVLHVNKFSIDYRADGSVSQFYR